MVGTETPCNVGTYQAEPGLYHSVLVLLQVKIGCEIQGDNSSCGPKADRQAVRAQKHSAVVVAQIHLPQVAPRDPNTSSQLGRTGPGERSSI